MSDVKFEYNSASFLLKKKHATISTETCGNVAVTVVGMCRYLAGA